MLTAGCSIHRHPAASEHGEVANIQKQGNFSHTAGKTCLNAAKIRKTLNKVDNLPTLRQNPTQIARRF
ncbi:hypothetical protein [Parahaliea aestuarii]